MLLWNRLRAIHCPARLPYITRILLRQVTSVLSHWLLLSRPEFRNFVKAKNYSAYENQFCTLIWSSSLLYALLRHVLPTSHCNNMLTASSPCHCVLQCLSAIVYLLQISYFSYLLLLILSACMLHLSKFYVSQKSGNIFLTHFHWLIFTTEADFVYCAVRTGSSNII